MYLPADSACSVGTDDQSCQLARRQIRTAPQQFDQGQICEDKQYGLAHTQAGIVGLPRSFIVLFKTHTDLTAERSCGVYLRSRASGRIYAVFDGVLKDVVLVDTLQIRQSAIPD